MVVIKSKSFSWSEYTDGSELAGADQELIIAARSVAQNAYAPYSGFRVGAAIRLNSGAIVTGTNVENAAFPSGLCAERSALANASSNHPGDYPLIMAIAAFTAKGEITEPVAPCGNCRQVIAEEEYRSGNNIKLILAGKAKIMVIESAGDLIPLQFSQKSLNSDLQK